MLAVREIKKY
jgi:histone H3